jgi:hypothetical protein
MHAWSVRRRRDDDDDELRLEVERLQQENMRLRLETQRPLSMGKLADELAQLATGLGDSPDPNASDAVDAVDAAHHVLASAEVTRQTVLNVLESLTIAAAQLRRQLETDVPPTELDRRVHDRRATVTTVANHRSSVLTSRPAHAEVPVDVSQGAAASSASP